MEHRKVVIIGAGHVGSHCAYALASAGYCEEIVLVDLLPEKAAAQALDVADSASFMDHAVTVRAGGYGECKDAALVVIAIGEPRLPGQTRLDLLGRSVELLKTLANELKPLRLTCPVVTITNPADIVADWLRRALELERWQCFGTGTLLDTARLVRCVSQGAGVDRRSVSAFCMGEHGDSSMVPFSTVTVGGVPLRSWGCPGRKFCPRPTRREWTSSRARGPRSSASAGRWLSWPGVSSWTRSASCPSPSCWRGSTARPASTAASPAALAAPAWSRSSN